MDATVIDMTITAEVIQLCLAEGPERGIGPKLNNNKKTENYVSELSLFFLLHIFSQWFRKNKKVQNFQEYIQHLISIVDKLG